MLADEKRQKTILLVEDEAFIAMAEKISLEQYGYTVISVHSGERAVETVKGTPYIDLVLMDIHLGAGIDGTEAARQILEYKDIPVVFAFSQTEPEVMEKTEKITSYGYVVKNSNAAVLDASIKMAFKLYVEKRRVHEAQKDVMIANEKLRAANEELESINEELTATNEELIEAEKAILDREKLLSNKIDIILTPNADISGLELKNIIDIHDIQSLLDDFCALTGMATALLDLQGNVLIATGWLDICTKFHRVHPTTAAYCTESDLHLSQNLQPGEFVDYKCKNGLWDVVTPLYIGEQHVGNIFTGQFFYDDDVIDEEAFSRQAELFGFEKDAYLKALHDVPTYSKDTIYHLMCFLVKFFKLVSRLGYSNILLAKESADLSKSRKELHHHRVHLEELVSERTAALQAANDELKSFAYIASHDLKAPLRAISRLSDWLAEDYADVIDERGKKMTELLIGRVKRMDNLIEGILEYSRIGRIVGQCGRIDLNELVAEVIDTLAPPDHIAVMIENELPIIVGDRIRLVQVFQNLIGNAIKFLDASKGDVRIGCVAEGSQWKFWVADTGPGIEERHCERIFHIFQTLNPRDNQENTGVGLAIVKKIVEFYRGKIWVKSIVGEGSTFFFLLPKEENTA